MCYALEQSCAIGRAEGEAKGRAEGEAEGKAIGHREDVRNLMDSFHISAEAAMDALKIFGAERQEILAIL